MKKSLFLALIVLGLIKSPIFAEEMSPTSPCEFEKGLSITFKANKETTEKDLKSVIKIIQKRLLSIGVCYKKIVFTKNTITITIPKFAQENKITDFLSTNFQIAIKKTISDEKSNHGYIWENTGFNEKMITSAELVENIKEKSLWNVQFDLNETGINEFNKISGKKLVLEIDGEIVETIILNEKQNPEMFDEPSFIKSPYTSQIFLTNIKESLMKKLLNEKVEIIFRNAALTQKMIKKLEILEQEDNKKPTNLNFVFNEKGKAILKEITERLNGKVFALEVNGVIVFQPIIREVIANGEVILSGNFTQKEITDFINNKNGLIFKEPEFDENFNQKTNSENKTLWVESKLKVEMIEEVNQEEETKIKLTLTKEGKELLEKIAHESIEKPLEIEVNNQFICNILGYELLKSDILEIKLRNEKTAKNLVAQINSGEEKVNLVLVKIEK